MEKKLKKPDYLTVQGYKVIRLGGKDRYETNQKIVDNLYVIGGTGVLSSNIEAQIKNLRSNITIVRLDEGK